MFGERSVRRGATLLDEKRPDWFLHVDPDQIGCDSLRSKTNMTP